MHKRRKKKRNRKKERTGMEQLLHIAKSRGGRGTMAIPDKKKYNRKKDKYKSSEQSEDFFVFYLDTERYQ